MRDLLQLLESMGSPGLSVPIGDEGEPPIAAIVVVVGPKAQPLLSWADEHLPGRRHGGSS